MVTPGTCWQKQEAGRELGLCGHPSSPSFLTWALSRRHMLLL